MRLRLACGALVAWIAASACGVPFGKQYEYDEQTYLDVDGSATVVLAASVPALVELRGLPLDPSPNARLSAADVRQLFESQGCVVENVSRPWRRDGRRFVQVRIALDHVRNASACGPLAWSTYRFDITESQITYEQRVGAPAGGNAGQVNWTGNELVTFKMHLPSRVLYHNVRILGTNETGETERGNILTWEQRLADRRAGQPLSLEVRTEAESILHQTMYLFVGAFAAAVLVLITIIWLVIRRGRVRLRELRR